MNSPSDTPALPTKARGYNAETFENEFKSLTATMENKRFCFLLGAGASKSSGIMLGGELANAWLNELHAEEGPDGSVLETWATAECLGIPNFTLQRAADFYTQIFERRFENRMDEGQFWIEQRFGHAIPSPGYYWLAQILQKSRHKVVLTTNFDNLAADAILQLTGNLPRIISDARIARYLSPQPRLPIIAKVHGDIGFATTKNTTQGVSSLDGEWETPLRRIFENYVPIIIGWEGNDGSLMDFLTHNMCDDKGVSLLPGGIFWCYRKDKSWQDRVRENPKLAALAEKHTVRFIQIDGFDEWVRSLALAITDENPFTKLQDQQKKRLNVFKNTQAAEVAEAKREDTNPTKSDTDHPKHDAKRSKELSEIEAMMEFFAASAETDPARKIERFSALVKLRPNDAMVLGEFARLLHETKNRHDEAEGYYQKALATDPDDASTLGNYALFLQTQRKDDERAEEYYRKALAAAPNHVNILCNYASFLQTQRKDDERAEEYYQKALATDPNHANTLGNYASFLQTQRKDSDRAEEYYQKALAADPNHVINLGNYARFLQTQRKDNDRAEEYYQKALAADPNHATFLGEYANFVRIERKDHTRAEEYYQKALGSDPNNANTLGNYASFLADQLKEYDGAEKYYQMALAADPNHATNLGNYAFFLADQRKDYDQAQEYYQKALAADPNHANNLGNYAEFSLIHRTVAMAVAVLERTLNCKGILEATPAHGAAAVLWISAIAAVKLGKSPDSFVAAVKGIVEAPGYTSIFGFGELIAWVEKNIEPAEEAAFWIAVAKVCGGTEKPASLADFPRWRDAQPLSLEEGLRAIADLSA